MEQTVAVVVTVLICGALLAVFGTIARSAGATDTTDVGASAARWRTRVFAGLVVAFVPIIGASLTKLPYPSSRQADALVVQATGHQWAWELAPATVPTGRMIEIRVTGADVNHGFGLYDADHRLLAQTQAMPGYTNILNYTFTQPGTYQVLCLEYCGLGHHTMITPLTVTDNRSAMR